MTQRRGVALRACLAWGFGCCLLVAAGGAARADTIDHLFAQCQEHFNAGSYRSAEWLAYQMAANSSTDGWKAASYNMLGRALNNQSFEDEAISAFRHALTYRLQPDNVNNGWIPNNLGIVYYDREDYAQAERYFSQARQFFERVKGTDASETAITYMNLGNCCKETKRYSEAERYYLRAMAIHRRLFGAHSENMAFVLSNFGELERMRGDHDKSLSYLNQALTMRQSLLGDDHTLTGYVYYQLAKTYQAKKDYERSEPLSRRTVAIRETADGTDHPRYAYALELLADDLEALGRAQEAADLRERAQAVHKAKATRKRVAYLPRVRVTASSAVVRASGNSIATVRAGQEFQATAANGPYVGVEVTVNGQKKSGWLRHTEVRALPEPGRRTAGAVWAKLEPEGARSAIEFPRSPKPTTQVVNGVENHAYTLESSSGTYVFSYFDLPGGTVLTFDAAIGAYASRRNGSVQSEKTLFLDEYPGKEYLVRLSGGTVSRLRLIQADRRWYQLIVEGRSDDVQSADAIRFLSSFKLK